MAQYTSTTPDTVFRCIPRHDGGYLVVTKSGASGVVSQRLPEGSRVVIRSGKAEAP